MLNCQVQDKRQMSRVLPFITRRMNVMRIMRHYLVHMTIQTLKPQLRLTPIMHLYQAQERQLTLRRRLYITRRQNVMSIIRVLKVILLSIPSFLQMRQLV